MPREAIGRIAADQHGVLTRDQLTDQGLAVDFAPSRLRSGEWVRLGHRVVAVRGAPVSQMQIVAAAVLSRPQAFASGRTAAWLHSFDGVRPSQRPEITVPYSSNARSRSSIIRRSQFFHSIATENVGGIRTASRTETIFRVAEYFSTPRLQRLIDSELLGNPDAATELGDIYLRFQGHRMRGMAKLRPILLVHLDSGYVPSESALETLADEVFDGLDIPAMDRQAPLPWAPLSGRVDRLIPNWKVIVELDGRGWHSRTEDFERDRRRDNAAVANGYVTIRLTWEMLKNEPERCRRLILEAGAQRTSD